MSDPVDFPGTFPISLLLQILNVSQIFNVGVCGLNIQHRKQLQTILSSTRQMETQAPRSRSPTAVPPYEEWPSVPVAPLKFAMKDKQTSAMDVDEIENNIDREARQTSELSMDDIEAAQALEGLRAGKAR